MDQLRREQQADPHADEESGREPFRIRSWVKITRPIRHGFTDPKGALRRNADQENRCT
jgi:hypothetical protein